MIRRALSELLASIAGSLMGRAVRLAGPPPPEPPRVWSERMRLDAAYDVAADATAVLYQRHEISARRLVSVATALDRARTLAPLSPGGGRLCDRRGRC